MCKPCFGRRRKVAGDARRAQAWRCCDCGKQIARTSTRCKPCDERLKADASELARRRKCGHCGKTFLKKKSSAAGDGNKYCSRECAFQHKAERSAARNQAIAEKRAARQAYLATKDGPHTTVWFRRCKTCDRPCATKSIRQTNCIDCQQVRKATPAPQKTEKQCIACGKEFEGHERRRYCTAACGIAAHRRAYKAQRRAKEGAAIDPINPYAVFATYGWKCAICGKQTPRARRGTNYSNAPELDHIIPLGLGGSHTYDNVQCACRSCNGKKGATRVLSQIPLDMGMTPRRAGV